MALTKVTAPSGDVIEILSPEDSRDISMGVDMSAMNHIVAKLTDLYTDPISATVREVVSNATDASVLIPKESRRPIEIVSPSTFKPSFTVRDFGIGMTAEIVEKIYSQYGGTTKKKDFTQIGAHGLGAKSPLSYCPEFSVSTTRDGITTDFLVSRKAEGNVTKILSVRETGNDNGTLVSIPVRMQDRDKFDKALDSYRNYSFDVPVSIDGVIKTGHKDYINFDEIVLDEDSDTKGRVWVHKNSLPRILKNAYERTNSYHYRSSEISVRYSLSGWLYRNPQKDDNFGARQRGYREAEMTHDVIVELKPGIVDFSSSRDDITSNDRSEALIAKVKSHFSQGSEYLIENILKTFRTLNPIDSMHFISKVYDLMKVENGNVIFGSGTETTTKSISDFTTDSGFNPVELSTTRHEENLLAIVHLDAYTLFEKNTTSTTSPFFYALSDWSSLAGYGNHTIAARNKRLIERVEGNMQDISIVDFFTSRYYSNSQIRTDKVIIVTGINSENIGKLNRLRATISRDVLRDYWALYTQLDSIPQDQLDLIAVIRPDAIETISADELITKATATRKASATANSVATGLDSDVYFTHTNDDAMKLNTVDLIKNLDKNIDRSYTSVAKIMAEKNIIVLNENNSNRHATLIGAANAGIKLTGKKIYFANKYDLKAVHYTALKDYDGVIASKQWSYNSKAANEISKNRSYSGMLLNEEVKGMSIEQAVSAYFTGNYRSFTNHFLDALITITEDKDDLEIFKTMRRAVDIKTNDYRIRANFNRETLAASVGDHIATKIVAFNTVSDTIGISNSLNDLISNQVIRSNQKVEITNMTRPIFDYVIEAYQERIEKIKSAAAEKVAAEKAAADALVNSDSANVDSVLAAA